MKNKTKQAQVIYYKGGSGTYATRICIPKSWMEILGVSDADEGSRAVKLTLKKGKIVIEKVEADNKL